MLDRIEETKKRKTKRRKGSLSSFFFEPLCSQLQKMKSKSHQQNGNVGRAENNESMPRTADNDQQAQTKKKKMLKCAARK